MWSWKSQYCKICSCRSFSLVMKQHTALWPGPHSFQFFSFFYSQWVQGHFCALEWIYIWTSFLFVIKVRLIPLALCVWSHHHLAQKCWTKSEEGASVLHSCLHLLLPTLSAVKLPQHITVNASSPDLSTS